jgi:hypothetical protein
MGPEDEELALATFVSVTSCDPGTSRAVLAVSGAARESAPFLFPINPNPTAVENDV